VCGCKPNMDVTELPSATAPLPHHHPLRARTADLLAKLEPTDKIRGGYTPSPTTARSASTAGREDKTPALGVRPEIVSMERASDGTQLTVPPETLKLSGYRDQLRELGNTLAGEQYRSLTQLDLSRNSLTSLKGLENLTALRQLSLYYNMVSDIGEMERLRFHPELAVLDMRLNPVTHAGPRYRMAVLNAAPQLQLLDEREVRGVERQRAGQPPQPPQPPQPQLIAPPPLKIGGLDGGEFETAAEFDGSHLVTFDQLLRSRAAATDEPDVAVETAYDAADALGSGGSAAPTGGGGGVGVGESPPRAYDALGIASHDAMPTRGPVAALDFAAATDLARPARLAADAPRLPLLAPEAAAEPARPGPPAHAPSPRPAPAPTPALDGTAASMPLPAHPAEMPTVGPTMAAAVAAAEERWSAERRSLQEEVARLHAQKEDDARQSQQTAQLVTMLQETHKQLIRSNEQLLAQLGETKQRHEAEVAQYRQNFDELQRTVAMRNAVGIATTVATAAPPAAAAAPAGAPEALTTSAAEGKRKKKPA